MLKEDIQYRNIYVPSNEYEAEKALRNTVLRQPLGLSLSADDIANEASHIHLGAFIQDNLIGCIVIANVHKHKDTYRIRQMAVMNAAQGKGIGRNLVLRAEVEIRKHQGKHIVLDARVSAKGFYQSLGYRVSRNEFISKTIPHVLMEKTLENIT